MPSTSSSADSDARGDRPDRSRDLRVEWLGRVEYSAALRLQHERVTARAAGEAADALLLLEHDPVITAGRGAPGTSQEIAGLPVVEVERGGELTYHGPGQLVGYPILRLAPEERDLHRYLRDLEEVLIGALADLGVAAGRNPPHTGVWVAAPGTPFDAPSSHKVASIGVAVRRWVTYHGFALNVAVDPEAFAGFEPCGLAPSVMTSLRDLGVTATVVDVAARVIEHFARIFGRRVIDGERRLG